MPWSRLLILLMTNLKPREVQCYASASGLLHPQGFGRNQLQRAAASQGFGRNPSAGQATIWFIYEETNLWSWILIAMNLLLSLWPFHQHNHHQPFIMCLFTLCFTKCPLQDLQRLFLVASWTQKMFCLGPTLCSGCLGPVEVERIWEREETRSQTHRKR